MSKIMFVVPSLSNGGAERVVSILSSELSKSNNEIYVVTYWATGSDYKVLDSVNLINIAGGDYEAYQKLSSFRTLKLIRKTIKSIQPDFIIPFLPHVCLQVSIASIGLKCIVIQTIRANPADSPSNKLRRVLRNILVKKSKCTLVQNEEQAEYFPKKYRKKLHVLPNPVDESFFTKDRNVTDNKFIVVSAGRLTKQKNFAMLIESFVAFSKNHDNVELNIYGIGELKDELQQIIIKNNVEEKIKLCGRSNNLPEVLSKASLFVMSSDFEGMPNSLMEAMSVGVPVISTDCPTGPKGLIGNNERGILVPVNNGEELSKSLNEVYNNYSHWCEVANNAKLFMLSNYSPSIIAERLLQICNNIK